MMKLDYYLIDPTKNMTILVETPVDAESQPFAASKLMCAEPTAEQVGFVSFDFERGDIRLRMAGGEFCGNATMSTAALYGKKCGMAAGESRKLSVAVSGTDAPVGVMITALDDDSFSGTVDMPRPVSISEVSLDAEGREWTLPLVSFSGISHLVVEGGMDRDFAERAVKEWCGKLGTDGLGLMLFDREHLRLDPLVYIPAADTLFWESSCASGTTAVGAWLREENPDGVRLELDEPGGRLSIEARPDGRLLLGGTVSVIRRGSLELSQARASYSE